MPTKKKTVSAPSTDWQFVLANVPDNMLTNEQNRRLALEKKITEIPDNVISEELRRRLQERRNRPYEGID